jgi:hypothetical protein
VKYTKELHDRVRQNLRMFDYPRFDDGDIDALLDEIERLQAERRWIPVSERLPEYDCTVLALLDDHTIIMCCYTTNGVGAFFDPDVRAVSDNFIEHPSHWMPLPEPPEAE